MSGEREWSEGMVEFGFGFESSLDNEMLVIKCQKRMCSSRGREGKGKGRKISCDIFKVHIKSKLDREQVGNFNSISIINSKRKQYGKEGVN